jgi:hypothetical protein
MKRRAKKSLSEPTHLSVSITSQGKMKTTTLTRTKNKNKSSNIKKEIQGHTALRGKDSRPRSTKITMDARAKVARDSRLKSRHRRTMGVGCHRRQFKICPSIRRPRLNRKGPIIIKCLSNRQSTRGIYHHLVASRTPLRPL